MRIIVRAIAACLALCFALPNFAAEPSLVRVQTKKSSAVYVGELISENDREVKILEITRKVEMTFPRDEVMKLTNPVHDEEAARTVGLPALAAWQISKIPEAASSGKIAKVTPTAIYLTLKQGEVRPDDKVSVYRQREEIKDPDTGEIIAVERPRIADLRVTEVQDAYSKAVLSGDLELQVQVGDEVELASRSERRTAVCPIRLNDGEAIDVGTELAEDLTNLLVRQGTRVVERSELAPVLEELLVESTFLFEPKEAQKLGQLTGASHVVVGKIVRTGTTGKAGKAYMRLVEVDTAEISYAVSATVALPEEESAPPATSTASSSPRSRFADREMEKTRLGVYAGPQPVEPTGRLVTAKTRLVPGQIVQVQWGSRSWYPATIKSVSGDTVIISYNGWGDRLEEMPRSKIALAPPHVPQPPRAAREP